ncbi:hypothetical protein BD410DRAFT_804374 [Rickenella mellea]|uniref:Uncharacterized protein n=1 Tax=Rickenella mellea TaxID=50990 RepID=A0A4Y7Q1Z2_9AGAM|nr:hypothetical protein BD410DRAFT_804374 [Rickenella mellea]
MADFIQATFVAPDKPLNLSKDPNSTMPLAIPSPPPSDDSVSNDGRRPSGTELDEEIETQRDADLGSLNINTRYHSPRNPDEVISNLETKSSPSLRNIITDHAQPKCSVTPSPIYVGLNTKLEENPHVVLVTTAAGFLASLQTHDELLNDIINFCKENGKVESARDDELTAIFGRFMTLIIGIESAGAKQSCVEKFQIPFADGVSEIARIMKVLQGIMDVHASDLPCNADMASEISNLEGVIQRQSLPMQRGKCRETNTNDPEEVHGANVDIPGVGAGCQRVHEALCLQMQSAKNQNKRINSVASKLGVLEYSEYSDNRLSSPTIILRKKEASTKSAKVETQHSGNRTHGRPGVQEGRKWEIWCAHGAGFEVCKEVLAKIH